MADLPAEHETLRELMKQPGMSIGVGLVALGCAGLLFAIGYLWMMPRSHLETAAAAAVAPKPVLVEQRSPPPITAMPSPASIALPAGEPVVERSASLPEMPPAPAPSDAAAADAALIAEAEPTAATPLAAAPVATAPVAAAPTTPVVAPPPSAQAMASPTPTAADVAAPAPAQPVEAAASPPATAKGYRLQLGAMRTPESAKEEWDRLQHQNDDVLGKLAYAAPRVDLGNRGVFYRIQAGPIAAATDANRACNELKQRGVSCILVKP